MVLPRGDDTHLYVMICTNNSKISLMIPLKDYTTHLYVMICTNHGKIRLMMFPQGYTTMNESVTYM